MQAKRPAATKDAAALEDRMVGSGSAQGSFFELGRERHSRRGSRKELFAVLLDFADRG